MVSREINTLAELMALYKIKNIPGFPEVSPFKNCIVEFKSAVVYWFSPLVQDNSEFAHATSVPVFQIIASSAD